MQQAWLELDVPQCGFCQPGPLMTAVALLNSNRAPTDTDIDAIENVCRCGTYGRIQQAIKHAEQRMRGPGPGRSITWVGGSSRGAGT